MAIDSGLSEQEQSDFSEKVIRLANELPTSRSPEQRLTALLFAVWADASQSGITPGQLAMMAVKAFNTQQNTTASVTRGGE